MLPPVFLVSLAWYFMYGDVGQGMDSTVFVSIPFTMIHPGEQATLGATSYLDTVQGFTLKLFSYCACLSSHQLATVGQNPFSSALLAPEQAPSTSPALLLRERERRQPWGAPAARGCRTDWHARSGLPCAVGIAGQIKILGRISVAHGLFFMFLS